MRRPNLLSWYRWLAIVTAGLVLIQALLAGRGLWINPDLIDVHEILANILFVVVIVQLGLTLAIGIPGALGKRLLILNAVLVALILVQTGLGYAGREEMEARAWHIPVGVLIFGLAVLVAALVPQVDEATGNRQ